MQTTELPDPPTKPPIGDGVFLGLVSSLAGLEVALLLWLVL